MQVFIANNISIEKPIPELLKWIEENLVVDNPLYLKLMKLGKEEELRRTYVPKKINLYQKCGDYYSIPRGCLYGIWKYIKNSKMELAFNKPYFIDHSHFLTDTPIKLYDYQEKAVNALLDAKSGILKAGTGAGKTECCVELVRRIGQRTLCLVHTHDLLNQMKNRFLKYYPKLKIGTITEGKIDIGEDITIATWQTMKNINSRTYENLFNVVIIDEAHHLVQNPTNFKQYAGIVEMCRARYTFGLTATPYRADSLTPSMYAIIGLNKNGDFAPVIEIKREDCNVLTSQHFEISTNINPSYDYLDDEGKFVYNKLIDYLSTNEERNKIIVDNVHEIVDVNKKTLLFTKHSPDIFRKQLVLCSRVEQAEIICNMINERKKLRAVLLVGKVNDKKRQAVLSDLNGENWDVIVSTYNLAQEGLDLPILSVLHLASPQKDKKLIVQSVGRVERVKENKPEPYVLDYVDNKISYCQKAFVTRRRTIKNRK